MTGDTSRRRGWKSLWQGLQLQCIQYLKTKGRPVSWLCFTRTLAFPSHLHVAHGQIAAPIGAVFRLYLESAHLYPYCCYSSPRLHSQPLLGLVQNHCLLSHMPHTPWFHMETLRSYYFTTPRWPLIFFSMKSSAMSTEPSVAWLLEPS